MVNESPLHLAGGVNVVVSAATLLAVGVASARSSRPCTGGAVVRGALKTMPAAGASGWRFAMSEYLVLCLICKKEVRLADSQTCNPARVV